MLSLDQESRLRHAGGDRNARWSRYVGSLIGDITSSLQCDGSSKEDIKQLQAEVL